MRHDFWQMAYEFGWATIDDLKQAVVLELITADEFQQITGQAYTDKRQV